MSSVKKKITWNIASNKIINLTQLIRCKSSTKNTCTTHKNPSSKATMSPPTNAWTPKPKTNASSSSSTTKIPLLYNPPHTYSSPLKPQPPPNPSVSIPLSNAAAISRNSTKLMYIFCYLGYVCPQVSHRCQNEKTLILCTSPTRHMCLRCWRTLAWKVTHLILNRPWHLGPPWKSCWSR